MPVRRRHLPRRRAALVRFFDRLSGQRKRALPVLSVMLIQAELWDIQPQGSNPCRNMRRYRTKARERFRSLWFVVRQDAGLQGVCIHDARHTYASQGVMNGVGLTAVGRLLGHRKRTTTAIYAHLDDAALQCATAQAAAVVGRSVGFQAEPPPMPVEALTELFGPHASSSLDPAHPPLDWTE